MRSLIKCPPVTGTVTCCAEPLHLRNISSVAREKSWRGHPDMSRFTLQGKAKKKKDKCQGPDGMKSCSLGSLAQPEKPGQGSLWSWYRNRAVAQCSSHPVSHNCYAIYSLFPILYLVLDFYLKPGSFGSRLIIYPAEDFHFQVHIQAIFAWVCCSHGWMLSLERCTFELVWSQWLACGIHEEVLKFLFQGFDMSACVSLARCQDALCQ